MKIQKLFPLAFACLFICTHSLFAQTFESKLLNANFAYGNCVYPTADGSYVVAGSDATQNGIPGDFHVLKVDNTGKMLWTKKFGLFKGSAHDDNAAYSIIGTSDDSYIAVGYYGNENLFNDDGIAYVIKLNTSGDTIWTRQFQENIYPPYQTAMATSIVKTTDGGYLITVNGSTYLTGMNLIKIDSAGNKIFDKTIDAYNTFDLHNLYSIEPTADGNYIIAGNEAYSTDAHVLLMKTDGQGDTLWQKRYYVFSAGEGQATYARQTSDKGYIITGWETDSNLMKQGFILKTDQTGNTVWYKTYGGKLNDEINGIQQTSDGGYLFTGQLNNDPSYDLSTSDTSSVWVEKIDSTGNMQWVKLYGEHQGGSGNFIRPVTGGGFVITGWTGEYGPVQELEYNPYCYLLRLNESGNLDNANGAATVEPNSENLIVMPNPCTECLVRNINDAVDVTVLDLLGRKINYSFIKSANGYLLHFAEGSGVFILRDNKTGEVTKFIKE